MAHMASLAQMAKASAAPTPAAAPAADVPAEQSAKAKANAGPSGTLSVLPCCIDAQLRQAEKISRTDHSSALKLIDRSLCAVPKDSLSSFAAATSAVRLANELALVAMRDGQLAESMEYMKWGTANLRESPNIQDAVELRNRPQSSRSMAAESAAKELAAHDLEDQPLPDLEKVQAKATEAHRRVERLVEKKTPMPVEAWAEDEAT